MYEDEMMQGAVEQEEQEAEKSQLQEPHEVGKPKRIEDDGSLIVSNVPRFLHPGEEEVEQMPPTFKYARMLRQNIAEMRRVTGKKANERLFLNNISKNHYHL